MLRLAAAALIAASLALPAAAQDVQELPQPDVGERPLPFPMPPQKKDRSGKDRSANNANPEEKQAKPRRNPLWRGRIPDGGAERAKLLDELYRQLAASTDEKLSASLDKVIQQVWLTSGSDTIDLLMRRALTAQKASNNKLAIELLDRIVDLRPDYAEGFARRAYIHYAEEDIERAVGDLRRAIALDPNHFKALDGLGDLFKELGRKKAALAVYRRVIKIHPHAAGVKTAIQQLELELEGQGI
jgi:tetratricopeptide (TPR) repeat protein